ncbi:MAG TPA: GIY-YIG nuclease family protein [Patescibacteria group bacterium]|nr:GIY-YIG nuclease family protein [Patescibacteria group bacterium]
MKFFVYLLTCSDKTFYIGSTNNLEKRIHEHNTSKNGAHYTKIRRPVVLKYFETVGSLSEARKREAELKRLKREEKEKLVMPNSFLPPFGDLGTSKKKS